jgi:hypothetical protein
MRPIHEETMVWTCGGCERGGADGNGAAFILSAGVRGNGSASRKQGICCHRLENCLWADLAALWSAPEKAGKIS